VVSWAEPNGWRSDEARGRGQVTRNPLRCEIEWNQPARASVEFHRRLPGYEPTVLLDAPGLARVLGVGKVLVKAETSRFGMPSFKILGASWAVYRALTARLGIGGDSLVDLDDLRAQLAPLKPLTLVAATDGNHGHAVARMANLLGLGCRILVPNGVGASRIGAIRSEGAEVVEIRGTYDDAVRQAAQLADARNIVVSDTSWQGYEAIPADVIDGYSTILVEVDEVLEGSGIGRPDIVVAPVGVGALMSSVVSNLRSHGQSVTIVGVEPEEANCLQASTCAGRIVDVPGPHPSIMVGLNCGTPSPLAWERVAKGVDWFVSVGDDMAMEAMRGLADVGLAVGETGAAALAGFMAISDDESWRDAMGDLSDSTILLLVTEGVTDPDAYRSIVGRSPAEVHASAAVSKVGWDPGMSRPVLEEQTNKEP